LITGR